MSLQKYYKSSQEYRDVIGKEENINIYAFYGDLIERVFTKGATILDVGCGTGKSTLLLNKKFGNVVGLDLSYFFLKETKSHNMALQLVTASAEKIPFRDEFYDIVASNSFIEHVPEVGIVINELIRIVKPKGYLVFHGPNLLSPITPIVKAGRKILGQKTSPIFGKNFFDCFYRSFKNVWKLYHKKLNENYTIEYRDPDFSFHGDDADATWFLNPIDLVKILRKSDMEIVLSNYEITPVRNYISKLFPNILGLSVIAQKK